MLISAYKRQTVDGRSGFLPFAGKTNVMLNLLTVTILALLSSFLPSFNRKTPTTWIFWLSGLLTPQDFSMT